MGSPTYRELLTTLFTINRHRKVQFGLDKIKKFGPILGDRFTDRSYKVVHVAGTNGKGSVSTKVAHALQGLGYRVGLFTSPHLATFRERIQVNGELIPEQSIRTLLPPILDCAERNEIHATFFEMTTVLAFAHFTDESCDFAVIEVGLGGTHDSTNVVSPVVSAITSIGLEHTQILGDTIDLIAEQKAGIIKPGVPVVIGPTVPSHIVLNHTTPDLVTRITGDFSTYDACNNAVSTALMDVLFKTGHLERKIKTVKDYERYKRELLPVSLKVRPPCRFQIHEHNGVTVVLDVAHNPDGLRELFRMLSVHYPNIRKRRVVVGLSKEKDIAECLKIVDGNATTIHFLQSNSLRAASYKELIEAWDKLHSSSSSTCPQHSQKLDRTGEGNIGHTVTHALQQSSQAAEDKDNDKEKELVVICGTFFVMQDVRDAVGIEQDADPADLNEVFGNPTLPPPKL